MIVVSDTSPINYLVLIGAIDVLPHLFDRVVIPPEVLSELNRQRAPDSVRAWSLSPPGWLEVIASLLPVQTTTLHLGETAAIALAEQLHADALLIDERDAARAAAKRGHQVIGTLAVLGEAASRDLIDLPTAIDKLRSTNFRMPNIRVRELLERDARRRKQN